MMGMKVNIKAVNHCILTDTEDGKTYLVSYDLIIACRNPDGSIVLDERTWDYSTTTGKHRNEFLGENIAETRKKIKSGVYKMADLNSES